MACLVPLPEATKERLMSQYRPVPPQVDLPAMEREILEFWDAQDVFSRSLEQTAGGKPWTFYEGPPTANGMPGTHHIEARVFKDVFPRFRTMQGFYVDRKAGWDCHGLPVELAVENELGFNGKPDIEAYGVEAFNAKCRESVSRNVDAFAELTQRMGYWVNLDEAYWTMSPDFVQSVWWALKQIHSKGLLVEDYRVAPYCPRCGTTLSDHELAQGYETVTDPSVYVRFPLTSGPFAGKASMLVWTTTPWTLVANTAVAVNPDVTYVVASDGTETLVVAEQLAEKVLGDGWRLGQTYKGTEMEGWTYARPFELIDFPDVVGGTHYVLLADYVTTEDGSGLVHQAPAFGEDDMITCRKYGLPLVNPIRPDGTFEESVPLVGGMFFKTADAVLVEDLQNRGLMYRVLSYEHSYPHCWRCHTVLLYYAQPSWYIRTTQIKDALLRENESTNWYPDSIKHGRYGDWLDNNVDWALSRSRYWGTPLPIWRCQHDHQVCVGSLAELSELAHQDFSELDPHRPYVDDVTFTCPTCGEPASRVKEVIDAWFDSGSMPFAQWGYPYVEGSKEKFEEAFPADFICEAIDQTRGWFYSLMAVATLAFDQNSYRNVLCLGHILAEDGRKMSKHLGNILEPFDTLSAGTRLSAFTDDLSNWYVRRSRRRFWDGEASALQTLHEVLDIVTRLMAPIVPFVTERVWQDLIVTTDANAPTSVHLASWPLVDESLIDVELSREMGLARRVVELGRAARSEARVKTRQPLSRALLASTTLSQLNDEIVAEVIAELNVGALDSFSSAGDLVDYSAKGNFRALGKRFGKQTPLVAQAIADADAHALAAALHADGKATVAFEGLSLIH